jgi:hypothetical protein
MVDQPVWHLNRYRPDTLDGKIKERDGEANRGKNNPRDPDGFVD